MKLLGQVVSLKDKREPLIYVKEWRRVKGGNIRAGRICWFDPSPLWHSWQRGKWEESKVVNSQQKLLTVFYCKENFTNISYRWTKWGFKKLYSLTFLMRVICYPAQLFARNSTEMFPNSHIYITIDVRHIKNTEEHTWKSGYNFVNAVTFESGISYHDYFRKYLWRMPPGILLIFLIPYCARHGAKRKLTLWRCWKKVHILHLFHRK